MDQTIRPIELYQIDQTYFVLDGNHRVSVARQRGMTHIPAYVTKIESSVPLTPEDDFEDLIIKNQQVRFRKDTSLGQLRPDLEFATSIPGSYQQLRDQISTHQLKLEMGHHYPYSFQEAAENWVEDVYLPVLQTVSQSGLLRDFPERTPTDLYIWLTQYQQELSRQYGWDLKPAAAVDSLAAAYGNRLIHRWRRLKKKLSSKSSTQPLEVGDWRRVHLMPRKEGQIFSAILVALNGHESGWKALEQAFTIADIEGSSIAALHIRQERSDSGLDHLQYMQSEFKKRSGENNPQAKLYIESGEMLDTLNQRALWNDLLIFSLEHPPDDKPTARLRSGLRSLVQSCPRPLLAVPAISRMRHGLLAFDGSPKATEALYLAAYLAEKWGIQLTVVSALEDSTGRLNPIEQARQYLSARNITAIFISEFGAPAEMIMKIKNNQKCDFLIVGGYGYQPVMEVLFGSTLDTLLRQADVPVLICH
jgi:nucleotide-binding universal stress UspA family protein